MRKAYRLTQYKKEREGENKRKLGPKKNLKTMVVDMETQLSPHPDNLEEPHIPHNLTEDEYLLENIEILQVKVGLVEHDTNEDEW